MDIIDRLRVEAAWWLVAFEGGAKVAIVLAIVREKEEIVFEQWKPVVNDNEDDIFFLKGKPTPTRSQKVIITRSDSGEVRLLGQRLLSGLTISARLILRVRTRTIWCIPQLT